jgi:hypothetical protein
MLNCTGSLRVFLGVEPVELCTTIFTPWVSTTRVLGYLHRGLKQHISKLEERHVQKRTIA